MSDKLQKLLAHAGYGSRREIEKWISLGRISLNGKRAKLGDRANGQDRLLLDGELINLSSQRYEQIKALIYHKPEGEICTRKDPKGRPTIFDNLPAIPNGRWVSVGRLDINTSGVLLLTNNGDLANKMMHPSTGLEREYLVRIRGRASDESITRLTKEGVLIDGKSAHFESVIAADLSEEGTNHWYRVIIKEGRYREVRRMWDEVGHTVSRLKRIRYGSVKLARNIKLGQHERMAPKQIEKLVNSVGLSEQFQLQLYSAGRSGSSVDSKRTGTRKTESKTSAHKKTGVRPSRLNNDSSVKSKGHGAARKQTRAKRK